MRTNTAWGILAGLTVLSQLGLAQAVGSPSDSSCGPDKGEKGGEESKKDKGSDKKG